MTAANDSVDPIDQRVDPEIKDLPVREQSADEVVGGSTVLGGATEVQMEEYQMENSNYTAISNILKTKHDTVKNSISNVR